MSYCNLYGPPPTISEVDFRFQILDRAFSEFQENVNEVRRNLSSISEGQEESRQRIDSISSGMEARSQRIDSISSGMEARSQRIDGISLKQEKISQKQEQIGQRIEKLKQQMDRRAENNKKCKNDFKISEIKDSVLRKSIAIGALALMIITGTIATVFGSYLLSAPCLVIGTAGIIKCSLSIAEDVKQIKCLKV